MFIVDCGMYVLSTPAPCCLTNVNVSTLKGCDWSMFCASWIEWHLCMCVYLIKNVCLCMSGLLPCTYDCGSSVESIILTWNGSINIFLSKGDLMLTQVWSTERDSWRAVVPVPMLLEKGVVRPGLQPQPCPSQGITEHIREQKTDQRNK